MIAPLWSVMLDREDQIDSFMRLTDIVKRPMLQLQLKDVTWRVIEV
jgi:hypothetical protein